MDFLEELSPLYIFPIIAVIICMLYTFSFKSPMQPPSFERIEDDKVYKKRKTKDGSKRDQGKVAQNGKLDGNSKSKSPGKKKVDKTVVVDKGLAEKLPNQKKVTKKTKLQNENKTTSVKKTTVTNEDTFEDGWVQLISKKARKNRKDEAGYNEDVTAHVNLIKHSEAAMPEEKSAYEETSEKIKDISLENSVPKKKEVSLKQVTQEIYDSQIIDSTRNKEKVLVFTKSDSEKELENILSGNALKNEKNVGQNPTSKPNKKKTTEVIETNIELSSSIADLSPGPIISKLSSPNVLDESSVTLEAPLISSDNIEENLAKKSKSSNVAFDELEGLYPQVKELKKKKKVRRDH